MKQDFVDLVGADAGVRPKRLLYFHQHFTTPSGASGTRSYEFGRALVARGWQVTMVCGTSDAAKLGLKAEDDSTVAANGGIISGYVDGLRVIALPVPYSNRDGIARRLCMFLQFAVHSARIALTEPCELIFATSTPLTAAIPGIFAKWFRKKPFVFEVRDLWPELPRAVGMKNPLLLGAMSLLEWLAYKNADALVGLSPGIVEGIRRRSPETTPIEMVPNGCDLHIFKPLTKSENDAEPPTENTAESDADGRSPFAEIPGINDGDFVAGFTGAHGIANGLDAVLDAAAELQRRGDTHIKLLFVGDGNRKDSLAKRAASENLANCIFHPPMPKKRLARLTASLDCGLMVLKNVPAFYRGTSPNKFFDYISAGIPVLNNYPGWLAELIRDNACGSVVPPENPVAFADALQHLAASPDRNASMRRNARALAEREFSREQLADKFCKFLEHFPQTSQQARTKT